MPRKKPSAPDDNTLPLERLLLDKENPRLASSLVENPSQEELVRVLWMEMAVDEVALSIAANGFYEDEPLLVVPEETSRKATPSKYVVVEGNRRLAAVILLREEELRKRIRATNLPEIGKRLHEDLARLPVSIHENRESVWAYLGFRHVNGTRPWDAFSKAKYVAGVHEKFGVSLQEIANRIGDTHSTVRRLYRGFVVLRQAEKMAGFDKEDRVRNRFYFSHLYTAVDYPEFQEFLGISDERWRRRDPVPRRRIDELSELMTWLYGKQSADLAPVVQRQNPDLNNLRRVISRPSALSLLRTTRSLSSAFEKSIGDDRRFRDALTLALDQLQTAKATVATGYKGDVDLLAVMEAIVATAQSCATEMQAKAGSTPRRRRAS